MGQNGENRQWREENRNERTTTNSSGGEEESTEVLGRIDQYELVKELGTGGFGSVYLARDTVSRTFVAVKGLPAQVKDSADEMERIRANFALVSRLRHPNVASALVLHPTMSVTYSDAEAERKLNVRCGQTLMVMEYAPGVTLSNWCRQFPDGKVPLDRAIEVTRQIAEALDYAHKRKIIHRDVKPANIMVETAEDGTFTARVLDFGLAAEVRSSMNRVSKEAASSTSGTRQYMSPEQWEGRTQGAAADQYALAALFYELVTGNIPFASAFDCGDPIVMMTVVTTKEPEIPTDLPKSVRQALARGLAKKSEERFASCGDFVAALEGKKVGGAMKPPIGKKPLLAACAAVAILAGGLGGWQVWRQQQAAEQARIVSEQQAVERARIAEQERKAKEEADRIASEKARQAERERLAKAEREHAEAVARTNVFRLAVIIENAQNKIAGETEDTKTFFAAEIHDFDNDRRSGDGAKSAGDYVEAVRLYRQAQSKADALKLLVDARKAYRAAVAEAEKAKTAADAVGAARALAAGYGDAKQVLESAEAAAKGRNFADATTKAGSAARLFADLRGEVIKSALAVAQGHRTAGRWQECFDAAEKVLGWEPGNAEAAELKAEANRNLEPTLRLVAKIGEREVRATLKAGTKAKNLPLNWQSTSLKVGASIPLVGCSVEYEEGGLRYVGWVPTGTVDWKGEKTIVVQLKKFEYDYLVSTIGELSEALDACRPGATIFLRGGEYLVGSLFVKKSVSIVGESRDAVKIMGRVDFYAADGCGNIDCKIKSVSVRNDSGTAVESSGYRDNVTLEIDDCDFQSGSDNALYLSSGTKSLAMRKTRIVGCDKCAALYSSPRTGETMTLNCTDCEIRNSIGCSVNVNGRKSTSVWERCRFIACSTAEAAFINDHHCCSLFNSCEFQGGAKGIQYRTSKYYDCKFSGPPCDEDAFGRVTKSDHKLTAADFEFD